MGTDCKISIDGEWHSLDRWYVFWQDFEAGKSYGKAEALKIIRKIKRRKIGDYDHHWLDEARKVIKTAREVKEVMIVDDSRLELYGYPSILDGY